MSFSTRRTNPQAVTTATAEPTHELTAQELEYLLQTLKDVDLKGYQVELFYNLIIKIQNQYIQKTRQ